MQCISLWSWHCSVQLIDHHQEMLVVFFSAKPKETVTANECMPTKIAFHRSIDLHMQIRWKNENTKFQNDGYSAWGQEGIYWSSFPEIWHRYLEGNSSKRTFTKLAFHEKNHRIVVCWIPSRVVAGKSWKKACGSLSQKGSKSVNSRSSEVPMPLVVRYYLWGPQNRGI